MPLYEYRCTQCNHRFEKLLRSVVAAAETACPSCGSAIVSRLPSTFAARSGDSGTTTGCAPSFRGG